MAEKKNVKKSTSACIRLLGHDNAGRRRRSCIGLLDHNGTERARAAKRDL